MMINGCKFDKDGNMIKRKKSSNLEHKNLYKNVKSRFKENLNYTPAPK